MGRTSGIEKGVTALSGTSTSIIDRFGSAARRTPDFGLFLLSPPGPPSSRSDASGVVPVVKVPLFKQKTRPALSSTFTETRGRPVLGLCLCFVKTSCCAAVGTCLVEPSS
uniref:Uncharacterized protein n=1 Tax=Knipowitschia caucasica TaxID=637954 RepID=A0AAV2JH94_KNICA